MPKVSPPPQQRVAQRGQLPRTPRPCLILQLNQQIRGSLQQRRLTLTREPQQIPRRPILRGHPHGAALIPLQQHVRIRPTHPKGTHRPITSLGLGHRPRTRPRVHVERTALPIDVITELLTVQTPRDHSLPQRLRQTDQTHQPRGGKAVTQVALGGGERTVRGYSLSAPKGLHQRIDLYRIPQPRPRPVRHHVLDLIGSNPRAPVYLLQQLRLRCPIRSTQPVGASVVVDPAPADQRIDLIPIRLGAREPLQHHHRHRLRGHHPIGTTVKGVTATRSREHPRLAQPHISVRQQHQVHTRRERRLTLPRPQAQTRLVGGHQPRGAGGVDRHRRTAQVQEIRQPRGQHRFVIARDPPASAQQRGVIPALYPHEHPDLLSAELRAAVAGILQRPEGLLQQQPLPRIHQQRLLRGDLEEQRIKLVHPGEHPQPLAVALARCQPLGPFGLLVVAAPVKALPRNLLHRLSTLNQDLPQLSHRAGSRKAPAHPHDRDRLGQLPANLRTDTGARRPPAHAHRRSHW